MQTKKNQQTVLTSFSINQKKQKTFSNKQNQYNSINLPSLNNTKKTPINKQINQSRLTKLANSRFLGYDIKRFSQKVYDKIENKSQQDYKQMTKLQLIQQYQNLKIFVKKISQKLNQFITNKLAKSKSPTQSRIINSLSSQNKQNSILNYQTNNLKVSTANINLKESIVKQELYSKLKDNNQKIKLNKSSQLSKLIKRQQFILSDSNDAFVLKKKLKQQILKAQEQLKIQKRNYKIMILQSNKIGNQIVNTDKLIQQIHLLEDQLNVLEIRKKKLIFQQNNNKSHLQQIQQKKIQIYQKQYELDQFSSYQKHQLHKNINQTQLTQEFFKKQRIITALKKDKRARDKIKTKQYFDKLSSLNQKQEISINLDKKYHNLILNIQNSIEKYNQAKFKYQQMIIKKPHCKKILKKQEDEDKRISFYKTKKQLDFNQKQPKQILKQVKENLQATQKNILSAQKLSPKNHLTTQQQIQIQQFNSHDEDQNNLYKQFSQKKQQQKYLHIIDQLQKKEQLCEQSSQIGQNDEQDMQKVKKISKQEQNIEQVYEQEEFEEII